jgi:hypothetical protein
LPVEQVRCRFDDQARFGQFLLAHAQNSSQALDLLRHLVNHLANGVDLHLAALIPFQGEPDRKMLREPQEHRVFRIRRGRLCRNRGERLL